MLALSHVYQVLIAICSFPTEKNLFLNLDLVYCRIFGLLLQFENKLQYFVQHRCSLDKSLAFPSFDQASCNAFPMVAKSMVSLNIL